MKRVVQAALRWSPRGGISLVEVLVALLLLASGMLAVTSAGGAVVQQMKIARTEVDFWGALQTVGDSLQQLGFGKVTDGSRAVGPYSFVWTVDHPVANLDVVAVAGSVTDPVALSDSVLIYLADY